MATPGLVSRLNVESSPADARNANTDSDTLTHLAAALAIFVTSLVGTWAARGLKDANPFWLSVANCFGGGVFLSAGFIHLLADAMWDVYGFDDFDAEEVEQSTDCLANWIAQQPHLHSAATRKGMSAGGGSGSSSGSSSNEYTGVEQFINECSPQILLGVIQDHQAIAEENEYPWIFFTAALGALATLCIEEGVQVMLRWHVARSKRNGAGIGSGRGLSSPENRPRRRPSLERKDSNSPSWSAVPQESDNESEPISRKDSSTGGGVEGGIELGILKKISPRSECANQPHGHSHSHSHDHGHGHSHGLSAVVATMGADSKRGEFASGERDNGEHKRGAAVGGTSCSGPIVLVLALSSHSFLAGLALGVERDIWATLVAILAHKGIETFALATVRAFCVLF